MPKQNRVKFSARVDHQVDLIIRRVADKTALSNGKAVDLIVAEWLEYKEKETEK